MDYLGGAASMSTTSAAGSESCLENIAGVIVAVVILRLEIRRHAAGLSGSFQGCASSVRGMLRQHIPEVIGLVLCLMLAAALRMRGGQDVGVDEKTWAEIVRQWPILLTADSLLALQAMLRLIVFLSAVLRGAASLPLSHEAATFFGVALVARAALALLSPVYMLDGPLGGSLPVVCEMASVPLLAVLGRRTNPKSLSSSILTIIIAVCIAYRNRLALAGDALVDGLFIFAHIMELLAASAYLCRALLVGVGRGCGAALFGHLMLPMQQVLAAYYFVHAFEGVPELVSAGHPFELLQLAGIVQLSAYAAAAVLHLAEYIEMPGDGDNMSDGGALSDASSISQPAMVEAQ